MVFLDRVVGWEARVFLGEEIWKFEIAEEQDRFVHRIMKKIEIVPKRRFIWPFDYSRTKGFVGHIDENSIWIRLKVAKGSWLGYLGWSAVCHFQGKFDLHNDSLILTGSYRPTPFLRVVWLLVVAAAILFTAGAIVVTAIALGMEFDWDLLVRGSVIFFGAIGLIFISFAYGRLNHFVTRNERRAIYELLYETSRSLGDLPPKVVAGS